MTANGEPPSSPVVAPSTDPEYTDFIAKLQAFHDERGTHLDPSPKVGTKRVNLLELYKLVTASGGYDAVSDTRAQKLAWRRLSQELHLGPPSQVTLAFSLKTAYYKNVVAYEIKNFHNQEPPPKEILEEVSAKGGEVMTRTLENFTRPSTRDELLSAGMDPEGADGSPKADSAEVEEPGSASARVTRGLRQAPTPRQMYQGEVATVRPTRTNSQQYSPAPPQPLASSANGTYLPSGPPQALANYEPKQSVAMPLKGVLTPGNNYEQFKAEQMRLRDAMAARLSRIPTPQRGLMPPGSGYPGASIYVRCLLALQCGILSEEEYALHHLVKISNERGDKYRFDGFPGLAEALINKVLEIGSLVLGVDWRISYQNPVTGEEITGHASPNLDATSRLVTSKKRKREDNLEPEEFAQRMTLITEAALVIRNMTMLEENAHFLARIAVSRAFLALLLTLPRTSVTAEVKQYALEIAEQLTRFYHQLENDQLFDLLLKHVEHNDRGTIIISLRAICRMSSHIGRTVNVSAVSPRLIQRLCDWVSIEDEELRSASLDFIYHYTAVPENVDEFLRHTTVSNFIPLLVRLLLHDARNEEKQEEMRKEPPHPLPEPTDLPIPKIAQDHIEQLLVFDEPDRSSQWLRGCFEEDPEGEITQIALWQAYQTPFSPYAASRPLLPAKDFITNVSSTFKAASAQVISTGPQPKFIIKGIKPRKAPNNPKGQPYLRCLWQNDDGSECAEFLPTSKPLFEHVVTAHLGVSKDQDGRWMLSPQEGRDYRCHWAGCKHFTGSTTPFAVGQHFKTHLPDSSDKAYNRSKHQLNKDHAAERIILRSWRTLNTAVDDQNDAAGLPLTSVLILRNLARNLPKTNAATKPGGDRLVFSYFFSVKDQLFSALACNETLREYLPSLIKTIEDGGG